MKLGTVVIGYCLMAVIVHCLFVAYTIFIAETDCIPDDRIQSVSEYDIYHFIAWSVFYFPFLVLCAFYIAFIKMVRSVCCCCWRCCGRNVDGNGATKCKICMDGVFGNPIGFAIIYTLWGVYEWMAFSDCGYRLNYGFGLDVVLIAFSLLLLCVWYFVRTKHSLSGKQKEQIARKYNDQLEADGMRPGNGGRADLQHEGQAEGGRPGGIGVGHRQKPNGFAAPSFSQNSGPGSYRQGPSFVAPAAPQYAHSAHGVSPYRPAQPAKGPVYAASAHGVQPYRPQAPGHQSPGSGASIEISVDLTDDGDDIIPNGGHHTRGPSLSFPSQFRGHARRVSSGILDILKRIDAEPECAICYEEFNKGDAMGQLECGHTFHKQCIVDWLKDHASCPICRKDMAT